MTTNGAANARKQMKLTATEQTILLDIAEDPAISTDIENDDNDDGECDNDALVTLDVLSSGQGSPSSESFISQSSYFTDVSGEEINFKTDMWQSFNDIGILIPSHLLTNVIDEFLIDSNDNEEFKVVVPDSNQMCNLLGIEQNVRGDQDFDVQQTELQVDENSNNSTVTTTPLFNSRNLPNSIFANWNNIICTSHLIQLSVRSFLATRFINKDLDEIRKTVRYFRRSLLASHYLSNQIKYSPDFAHALRPLLDLKTRWTSTLHMIKRYMLIEPVIYNAQL